MGLEAWVTLGVLGIVLALLATTRRAPWAIFMGAVTLLLVVPVPTEAGWRLGVIGTAEALRGFSSEGPITVAALFIVAAGVERTGVMHWLVDRLMGRPAS